MGFKKWDFVQVVGFNEKELKGSEMEKFIGAKGIIVEDKGGTGYQYDVVFFDMELQKYAMDDGWILWRSEDLEILEVNA